MMLVFVPIIGPPLAVATVTGWKVLTLMLYLSGHPLSGFVGTAVPWIALVVYGLAF
jgi:hypothetical protein